MLPIETETLGYFATVVGVSIMLPQVIKGWRARHMKDVSYGTIFLYMLNCILWCDYGTRYHSHPMVVSNALGFLIGTVELGIKIKFR